MTLANTEHVVIPDVSGLSVREAVEAYRAAGLVVFPVVPGSKRPAVEWTRFGLGDEWPDGDWSVGLPMHLNGLVAIDVDHPERVPAELAEVLAGAAFQSTEASPAPGVQRGHYVFSSVEAFGQSTARFPGAGWGDVRAGGFLVVAPSQHARPDGRYVWRRREVPPLPERVAGWLTRAGESTARGSRADLELFLSRFTDSFDEGELITDVQPYADRIAAGEPRNNVLPAALGKVFRKAVNGWYPAQAAYEAVEDISNTPDPYEPGRFEALAVRFARTAMDDPGDYRPPRFVVVERGAAAPLEDGPEFWTSRSTLATIRQAAKARMVGPYGLLGAVLVDVVAAVPPAIGIETFGGARASLNMFLALVGKSGAGKSLIASTVRDVINIPDRTYWQSLRSGEGLVHTYLSKKGKTVERIADSAVIDMDEVDRLTALSGRNGATIMPTLRTAWIAGTLGGKAATESLDVVLEHDSYRCCLVAGVQPGRSRALINDADGGTPQRFVFLPANDPDAVLDAEWPAPIEWSIEPDEAAHIFGQVRAKWQPRRDLTLPESVVQEWKQDRLLQARGLGDELDAHRMLATAKVAAALALLERREDVTEEDWSLARHLMRVSQVTRDGLKQHLVESAKSEARARGRLDAERIDATDEARWSRVTGRVLEMLRGSDGLTRGAVNRKLAARDRALTDEVLLALVGSGEVSETEGPDGQHVYRLVG